MGEAKKKRDKMTPQERVALEVTHKLANDGRIIEGGFAAFCVLNNIGDEQTTQILREAWFGAADHLLRSIMSTLDPGDEPTDKDMERMEKIDAELMKWREKAKLRYSATEGNA